MNPATFPEANTSFGPPNDLAESQCGTIRGYRARVHGGSMDGAPIIVVAWQPSPEDLARLNAGQPLFLSFIGGIPPHFPTTSFAEATNPA